MRNTLVCPSHRIADMALSEGALGAPESAHFIASLTALSVPVP